MESLGCTGVARRWTMPALRRSHLPYPLTPPGQNRPPQWTPASKNINQRTSPSEGAFCSLSRARSSRRLGLPLKTASLSRYLSAGHRLQLNFLAFGKKVANPEPWRPAASAPVAVASSAAEGEGPQMGTQWESGNSATGNRQTQREIVCQVEVLTWRKRRISAGVCVYASHDRVWEVLTDYGRLSEFIPNLVRSELVPCPTGDATWLLQQGVQTSMYWHIHATVVLEVQERKDETAGPELLFTMVEGDFKMFAGRWCLRPGPTPESTTLLYEVTVIPRLLLPAVFVERVIRADLPKNLEAIADRAEGMLNSASPGYYKALRLRQLSATEPVPSFGMSAAVEALLPLAPPPAPPPASGAPPQPPLASAPSTSIQPLSQGEDGGGSSEGIGAGAERGGRGRVAGGVGEEGRRAAAAARGAALEGSLAQQAGPLGKAMLEGNVLASVATWGGRGAEEWEAEGGGRRKRVRGVRAFKGTHVDEVHLRRLDDLLENGGVHRRVLAAVTIAAPPHQVWQVLTDYARLHEFFPNLARSEVVARSQNKVQLLQEGVKGLMYMVLHGRVLLDVVERPPDELVFRMVDGDFESFAGKWVLEALGTRHTLLKYVADARMRRGTLLAEALMEEVIYEDLPANLGALRQRVESIFRVPLVAPPEEVPSPPSLGGTESRGSKPSKPVWEKPRSRERGGTVGQKGPTPDAAGDTREGRRGGGGGGGGGGGRVSGGVADGSAAAGARKVQPPAEGAPKRRAKVPGLQRSLAILEAELRRFASDHALGPSVMPTRVQLREAGRVDLEKAVAKHGGWAAVATHMRWRLAHKAKPRGYWDSFQNLAREVKEFIHEHNLDSKLMPSRAMFVKSGRYDIARSMEKWGGLRDAAHLLGLQVRYGNSEQPRRKKRAENAVGELEGSVQGAPKSPEEPSQGGGNGERGPMKAPLPAKSRKWLSMKLVDEDGEASAKGAGL